MKKIMPLITILLFLLTIISCEKESTVIQTIEVKTSSHGLVEKGDTVTVTVHEALKIFVHSVYGEKKGKTDFSFISTNSGSLIPIIEKTGTTEGASFANDYEITLDCDNLPCESGEIVKCTIQHINTTDNFIFQWWIAIQ